MPIAFDRSVCCNLEETIEREWLVTNGLGGYAAGTVAGVLTRLQHGLLVSTPQEGSTPQLLLAKIDEEVLFDERTYYLGTNEYRDGTLSPNGFVHLESFHLEEGYPVFTYRVGGIDGILLEKRIWMPHGQNTTYIQYRVLRSRTASTPSFNGNKRYYRYATAAQQALTLTLLPLAAYRPSDQPQYGRNDWHFHVHSHQVAEHTSEIGLPSGVAGCTIRAWEDAQPYHLLAVGHPDSQTSFIPTGVWYWHFMRRHEPGEPGPLVDDLYLPGVIRTRLWPGEDCTLTIIVSAEELSALPLNQQQINVSYQRSVQDQHNLLQPQRYFGEGGETAHYLHVLPLPASADPHTSGEEYLRYLLQAADRFLIRRKIHHAPTSDMLSLVLAEPESIPLIISDCYSQQESIREMLISLPGLTLATGRYDEARTILHTLARYFKQGLLPDRLPTTEHGLDEQDYGSVDTTLWYFYALDHYLQATRDYELLHELYLRLVDSIDWYIRGTYNGIQVDSSDGLLRAEQPGKALTWMNEYHNGVPTTPRSGKPVEVNALWYHALSLMETWAESFSTGEKIHGPSYYTAYKEQCYKSFNRRYWNTDRQSLYDVVDGHSDSDTSLRPNQLLALSLRHSVLDRKYRQAVFESVTEHLLTPVGLRTLAPDEKGYQGHTIDGRKPALHQGSAWPWLLGPYIDAMLSIYRAEQRRQVQNLHTHQEYLWRKSLHMLLTFRDQLDQDVLGMVAAASEAEPPHRPVYQLTSCLSVGEILRIYNHLAHQDIRNTANLLSAVSNW